MANIWDDVAASWDLSPESNDLANKAFESLQELVDLKGLHILDFGCGTGLLSEKMAPLAKDIVALDSSEAMIEQLDKKELKNVEPVVDMLSRGLAAMHPAFRAQFDLVVASSVCSYLNNYSDIADIVFSLLDPGSYFVHWDILSDDSSEGGVSMAHANQVLTSVGFQTVDISTPFLIGSEKIIMVVARK